MAEHNVSKCLKSHHVSLHLLFGEPWTTCVCPGTWKADEAVRKASFDSVAFSFFPPPVIIWCEIISSTVRLRDPTLTKNKSEAKCSVTRVLGLNFGTTFKCALFLQELISMHWWPRITTANYRNMPGYRADPILRAAPTCPLQTWNKLIYFRGKVWDRSFYFYLCLSGT